MDPHDDVHWPPGWGPVGCDSFVCHERHIAAPAEKIFARLVTVADWPDWQRGTDRTELYDGLYGGIGSGEAVAVGGRFLVISLPYRLDGIVGELLPPARFGWAAVSEELSFYQSWLLVEDGTGTRTVVHEAARGPAALLQATARAGAARDWLDGLAAAVGV